MENFTLVLLLIAIFVFVILVYKFAKSLKRPAQTPNKDNYILGLMSLLDGRDDDAFEYFHKSVTEDTDNVDSYLRLGYILRKKGLLDRAFQIHKELSLRAHLSDSRKLEIQEAMIDDLFTAEKYKEAGRMLRDFLVKDSKNIRILERLLDVYVRTEDWVNAIPTAEKLSKLDKEKYNRKFLSLFKILEGKAYAEKGDGHKARIIYKEALNLDKHCAFAYLYIGDAYINDNRLDDAVTWWKKLCEQIPSKGYICFDRLESALFELGKFSVIAEIYLRIIEHDQKNIRALQALARIQIKMGKIPESINNLNKVLDIDSSNKYAALELFKLYKQENQYTEITSIVEKCCDFSSVDKGKFECSNCGNKEYEPILVCPECKKVDTYDI